MGLIRPTRAIVPKEIYAYELPTYSWNPPQWRFQPTVYEDISEFLNRKIERSKDRKIEICKLYASQVRLGVRGPDHIREFSVACGTEAKFEAAERFEVW